MDLSYSEDFITEISMTTNRRRMIEEYKEIAEIVEETKGIVEDLPVFGTLIPEEIDF